MEVWKEFSDNAITHSAAHYLMTIRELTARQGYARVSDIAEKLNITKGSASQSLKQLKTRGVVYDDEHRMLHLSAEGENLADRIAGRAQVLKHFFHDVLGIDLHQAEVDACKIEHLISPAVSERLISLVRYLAADTQRFERLREGLSEFQCGGPEHCPICDDKCVISLELDEMEQALANRSGGAESD